MEEAVSEASENDGCNSLDWLAGIFSQRITLLIRRGIQVGCRLANCCLAISTDSRGILTIVDEWARV